MGGGDAQLPSLLCKTEYVQASSGLWLQIWLRNSTIHCRMTTAAAAMAVTTRSVSESHGQSATTGALEGADASRAIEEDERRRRRSAIVRGTGRTTFAQAAARRQRWMDGWTDGRTNERCGVRPSSAASRRRLCLRAEAAAVSDYNLRRRGRWKECGTGRDLVRACVRVCGLM